MTPKRPLLLTVFRFGIAGVWLAFGLLAKVLQGVPRHQQIVARIVGVAWSGPMTLAVGFTEILIGLWVLSGRYPRWCALAQTLMIVTMNSLELWKARDLLLAPLPMVLANLVLLSVAWYSAFASELRRG